MGTYEEKTNNACTVNGTSYVSGIQKDVDISFDECKSHCRKFLWCKGIQHSGLSQGKCRLLTNQPLVISGWTYYNEGNWIEPLKWKKSTETGFKCFVKT